MKVSQVFISAISVFGLATSVNAQNASNTTSNCCSCFARSKWSTTKRRSRRCCCWWCFGLFDLGKTPLTATMMIPY
ncbi:CBM_collapsed_G0051940.mRNA.1.CDS.1 [Saccharomyces cerevisiae]|nr:CBM_collapsed_G0051940.mRNA.1.CDS.1 [Saccharomyces cerevisiae]